MLLAVKGFKCDASMELPSMCPLARLGQARFVKVFIRACALCQLLPARSVFQACTVKGAPCQYSLSQGRARSQVPYGGLPPLQLPFSGGAPVS